MACRGRVMFLTRSCQPLLLGPQHSSFAFRPCKQYLNIQVYRDSPAPQIVHPQHTADHILSQLVEHKHFPYRLALRIENRSRLGRQSVCLAAVQSGIVRVCGGMVEVQNALNRG